MYIDKWVVAAVAAWWLHSQDVPNKLNVQLVGVRDEAAAAEGAPFRVQVLWEWHERGAGQRMFRKRDDGCEWS
jgi:hypothetical protein